MLLILFYYIVLPFLLGYLVLRLIRRYGADPVPPQVRALCAEDPVEAKWFRVAEVRGDLKAGGAVAKLGDFDAQDKAVDAAYLSRGENPEPGRSWLVLNERGDILQEIA